MSTPKPWEWDRIEQAVQIRRDETGFDYRHKGDRYWHRAEWPRCDLAECDTCGRVLWTKRLRSVFRHDLLRGERHHGFWIGGDCLTVCIGCLGRIEASDRVLRTYLETRSLIARLQRECALAGKDQNNSRPSGIPPGDDGGRAGRFC